MVVVVVEVEVVAAAAIVNRVGAIVSADGRHGRWKLTCRAPARSAVNAVYARMLAALKLVAEEQRLEK